MSKTALNYWPSLLLLVVLVAGLVACLNRLDYLVVDEVRTLISILFGFATSCLLLSFIWLIQRKPRHLGLGGDVPSMNPRGRTSSTASDYMTISAVSSAALDVPPAYEDALVNSKPVKRHRKSRSPARVKQIDCNCSTSNRLTSNQPGDSSVKMDCDYCLKLENQHHFNLYTVDDRFKRQDKTLASHSGQSGAQSAGKISLAQLDVNQLALLSSSPPKYHELHLYNSNESHSQQCIDMDKLTADMT